MDFVTASMACMEALWKAGRSSSRRAWPVIAPHHAACSCPAWRPTTLALPAAFSTASSFSAQAIVEQGGATLGSLLRCTPLSVASCTRGSLLCSVACSGCGRGCFRVSAANRGCSSIFSWDLHLGSRCCLHRRCCLYARDSSSGACGHLLAAASHRIASNSDAGLLRALAHSRILPHATLWTSQHEATWRDYYLQKEQNVRAPFSRNSKDDATGATRQPRMSGCRPQQTLFPGFALSQPTRQGGFQVT